MTVVDASVVLKWLLAEPSAEAEELLERHLNGSDPLVAPELLSYEIGNVLVTKTKLSAQETSDLFGYFIDLQIEAYSLGADEYKTTIELAYRYKLSVYDAAYLGLALALDSRLVTADRRLANRAAATKIIQAI
jgi:predicted nucleic acid-binding protein